MASFQYDYSQLPYSKNGQHPDHNRFNWRCELLLTRNPDAIRDHIVLDLACNNGRFSYPCLGLGARKVVGIEARPELIEMGQAYLQGTGYEDRMEWIQSDLFTYLTSAQPGMFDTILCFGFLYHTVRQVEFFREIKRLAPSYVIIDTNVVKNYLWYGFSKFMRRPPALFVMIDDPTKTSDTTDEDGIVFFPSASFLEQMFDRIGYTWQRIHYSPKEIKDWAGMDDYQRGLRVSYIARRSGS